MHKTTPNKALFAALCLGGFMVCAQAVFAQAGAQSVRSYRTCVSMVARNPAQAFEAAQEWRDYGGGPSSQHCLALALVAQGMYGRAAELLEEIAATQPPLDRDGEPAWTLGAAQRADLLIQAGNAWLIAGKGDKAYSTFNDVLGEPSLSDAARGELLIDRSRALAQIKDYRAVIADLDRAAALLGERADILTYLASARRAEGALADAQDAIGRALQLAPNDPDALFERGILRYSADDFAGAKADWIRVGEIAPGTVAADAAAANIAALDRPEDLSQEKGVAPIRLELRGLSPEQDAARAPAASAQAQDGKAPTQP